MKTAMGRVVAIDIIPREGLDNAALATSLLTGLKKLVRSLETAGISLHVNLYERCESGIGDANATIRLDTTVHETKLHELCWAISRIVEEAFATMRHKEHYKVILIVNGPVHTIETFETE